MKSIILLNMFVAIFAGSAFASGFAVFTQGAAGLGQANAVVAHPTGPSSLYFNPALLNDVAGQQVEFGTTGIYADRNVKLDSGETEEGRAAWNFPSNAYYSSQLNDRLSIGFGLFFPFGLSTEWDETYSGRYLGTYGDIVSLNLNPVISYRMTDKLSVAGGFSFLYLDATLKKKINQTAAYTLTDLQLSGGVGGVLPALGGPLKDIDQRFAGDGWGYGFNLGMLYKLNEQISFGATYRSHIDVTVDGRASFSEVSPLLTTAFTDTNGQADIRLPAQASAGIAFAPYADLIIEAGMRWEDWSSTKELKVALDSAVLGQTADITPRDWKATWSYNLGGHYQVSESLALNAGYLFGEAAVPDSTFEPLVPDSDAHLFTVGLEWQLGAWTLSGAFGYEFHDSHRKNNALGDPLATMLTGTPTETANGSYETDIYLTGLSLGYRF